MTEVPNLKTRNLPLIVCWNIWMSRNNNIFLGKQLLWPLIIQKLCNSYNEIMDDVMDASAHTIIPKVMDKSHP